MQIVPGEVLGLLCVGKATDKDSRDSAVDHVVKVTFRRFPGNVLTFVTGAGREGNSM